MAENLYFMGNGYSSAPTTALPTAENSGTAGSPSVMLQIGTPSTRQISIVEYGVSMSGSPAASLLSLRTTGTTVAATNMVAGIITPYSNPGAPTALCTSSTSTCCYNNGTTSPPTGTTSATYDLQVLTTNTYIKQFPLAREPVVAVSSFLQLVLQVPTLAVTAYCYIIWRE